MQYRINGLLLPFKTNVLYHEWAVALTVVIFTGIVPVGPMGCSINKQSPSKKKKKNLKLGTPLLLAKVIVSVRLTSSEKLKQTYKLQCHH